MVENNDKKFADQKEHTQKIKEYLESKIQQTLAFEDKINILNEELKKTKMVADDFRNDIINRITAGQSET